MAQITYGYKKKNGVITIIEDEASCIRALYDYYISGMSITDAVRHASLDATVSKGSYILSNERYTGLDGYPQIISKETYRKALYVKARRKHNADHVFPSRYTLEKVEQFNDDPFRQAEYIYSRIKSDY